MSAARGTLMISKVTLMTVYARSDVISITVSKSHSGCGEVHRRPVANGIPARIWGLVCPKCEVHLSHDPLWSGTLAEVPDTPDEVLARDNVQKNTARSRDDLAALALAKIAGLPVADFLGSMMGQTADRGTVCCSAGHENFPSAKFCNECGTSLSDDATSTPSVTAGDQVNLQEPQSSGVVPAKVLPAKTQQPRAVREVREVRGARTRPATDTGQPS